MRSWSPLARVLPAALLALAACDGGNTFDPDRLTSAQVDALYEICDLRFVPVNTILPTANVRQGVMNLNPPATRPRPSLSLSNRSFDLTYTRKSDNFLQQLRGSYDLGTSEVVVRIYSGETPTALAAELLLPQSVPLRFADSPKRLTADGSGFIYTVRRADYARAAGISENDLQPTISGRLIASLQAPTCS
jgi:hypothetical protein